MNLIPFIFCGLALLICLFRLVTLKKVKEKKDRNSIIFFSGIVVLMNVFVWFYSFNY